ncbi:hypothetical protein AB1Y20_011175 [Prymnesium parvum]|uniref:TRUD domain-containing protein n=1 Tax=Prymnesium parvum TaxID=97485 RepID=A0AB34ILT8_PRYPA
MYASSLAEPSVGILELATSTPAFRAVTKQRYSDFIVHEISPQGREVRLTSLAQPPPPPPAASHGPSADGVAALVAALGEESARRAIALHARLHAEEEAAGEAEAEVVCAPAEDKEVRRAQHLAVKTHLGGVVSDTVEAAGGKCVRLQLKREVRQAERRQRQAESRAGKGGGKRRRVDDRDEWPAEAQGRSYLAFTLYKENRDTLDALGQIARALRLNPNLFTFAGTKDRRAVTTQRVTAFRVTADRLCHLMGKAPFGDSVLVGDVEYAAAPLRLGMHQGNRFTIVLRDVDCEPPALVAAIGALDARGFINYFGLQRFGSNAEAPTHHVGALLLRGDFKGAVELLLAARPGERDDERAARELWARTRDAAAVLPVLPRRMNIERALLEGLRDQGGNNYAAAYGRLPRALRMMYAHAFQSYLWNHAASERVRLHGVDGAVAGDLVLPGGAAEAAEAAAEAGGEEAAAEAGWEAAAAEEAAEGEVGGGEARVHVVSEEEAARGAYSIDEVVLPLLGAQSTLPANGAARSYEERLALHGVSRDSFVSRHGMHLAGGYRKLLQRPRELRYQIFRYNDPTLPLAATDLAKLRGEPEPAGEAGGKWVACRLEFTLPPSSYATMCLRELTKQPTDLAHQQMLNANSTGASSSAQEHSAAAAS